MQTKRSRYLADRTNGRAYSTVLRLSIVCLSVFNVGYVLWLNGAFYRKTVWRTKEANRKWPMGNRMVT